MKYKKVKVMSSPHAHVRDLGTLRHKSVIRFIGRQWNPETKTFDLKSSPTEVYLTSYIKQNIKKLSLIEVK